MESLFSSLGAAHPPLTSRSFTVYWAISCCTPAVLCPFGSSSLRTVDFTLSWHRFSFFLFFLLASRAICDSARSQCGLVCLVTKRWTGVRFCITWHACTERLLTLLIIFFCWSRFASKYCDSERLQGFSSLIHAFPINNSHLGGLPNAAGLD